MEAGTWEDPQPHSCQSPESLSGPEADCPECGSQVPAPYSTDRIALAEGEGELRARVMSSTLVNKSGLNSPGLSDASVQSMTDKELARADAGLSSVASQTR